MDNASNSSSSSTKLSQRLLTSAPHSLHVNFKQAHLTLLNACKNNSVSIIQNMRRIIKPTIFKKLIVYRSTNQSTILETACRLKSGAVLQALLTEFNYETRFQIIKSGTALNSTIVHLLLEANSISEHVMQTIKKLLKTRQAPDYWTQLLKIKDHSNETIIHKLIDRRSKTPLPLPYGYLQILFEQMCENELLDRMLDINNEGKNFIDLYYSCDYLLEDDEDAYAYLPLTKAKKLYDFYRARDSIDADKIAAMLAIPALQGLLNSKINSLDNIISSLKQVSYAEKAVEIAHMQQRPIILSALMAHPCQLNLAHTLIVYNALYSFPIDASRDTKLLLKDAIDADCAEIVVAIARDDWQLISEFKCDENKLDCMQYVVKQNAVRVLQRLVSHEFALKTASLCQKHHTPLFNHSLVNINLDLLNIQFIEMIQSQDNLILPLGKLVIYDFLRGNHITPKGLTLLLEYYFIKKVPDDTTMCVTFALGYETLVNCIKLFIESDNNSLTLLFADLVNNTMSSHRSVYRLDKYQGKCYVIALNSTNSEYNSAISHYLIKVIKIQLADFADQIVLCTNITNQQTDFSNCSHFALKNISKLLTTDNFAAEITALHVMSETRTENYAVLIYRLPARFMYLAQSHDTLEKYIENNDKENVAAIHFTKDGYSQSLREYAYQTRNKYGVKSPIPIANRHFDPTVPEGSTIEYIQKNLTIEYFANKYQHHTVPTLFSLYQHRLRNIVKKRDANNLAIDPHSNLLCYNGS